MDGPPLFCLLGNTHWSWNHNQHWQSPSSLEPAAEPVTTFGSPQEKILMLLVKRWSHNLDWSPVHQHPDTVPIPISHLQKFKDWFIVRKAANTLIVPTFSQYSPSIPFTPNVLSVHNIDNISKSPNPPVGKSKGGLCRENLEETKPGQMGQAKGQQSKFEGRSLGRVDTPLTFDPYRPSTCC